jgi:N-acetylglucosaminyldiphosphoundecaprenol N-acetyl-beta-D-mannosaminyltransferase
LETIAMPVDAMTAGAAIAGKSVAISANRNSELVARAATPRLSLGAVAIDTYSQAELIDDAIDHALHAKVTRQMATVNAQFYVLAHKHERFRECLGRADYLCADGVPIVWACNTFGRAQVDRIAGVDLMERLCERGAAQGLRVYLLGGSPGAAEATARLLSQRYPGVAIAGVNCPEIGFERREASLRPVLDKIARARPHLLFVGLGAPKQELLIHDHIRPLGVPLAIGIGGSFEILSGVLDRAPLWMQASGLEWAFRLWQEPRRLWKRYLIGNIEFLWLVAKWRLRASPGLNYVEPHARRISL